MLPFCPQPPDWHFDWAGLNQAYAWIREQKDCPQDPIYHAEGDVWIHLHMVCTAMIENPAWRQLASPQRDEVFWAALLHDVAKPATTRPEGERITARGHSQVGARQAREILWRMGVPFALRERIVGLVRYHQLPFWLLERDDPKRLLAEISQHVDCNLLTILAESDMRGRVCHDQQAVLDNIALFQAFAEEHHCLDKPMHFVSDYTRFLYFQGRWDLPDYAAHEPFKNQVILMSGLPGSGKDHWIRQHVPDLPVVSLDDIRRTMHIAPSKPQGPVVAEARRQATAMLRERTPFVWNATNISYDLRQKCFQLFERYGARVKIVYVEAEPETLRSQNRNRDAVVPDAVLDRLLRRWEVPALYEAHEVQYAVKGLTL